MASVETRLAAIDAEIERRRFEQEQPIDPLSQSMFEYSEWWESLTEEERQAHVDSLESAPVFKK